ncbi:monovalent cation:proton antiporter-2 (CPA2) family protein [Dyadobacter psychrotolerans]|uniref:Potassium transporter n=1 Tax=Dyadobacter psychrotolerans TaxID=2541721 RepID=A0A4R5DI29_9BACT|nr:monovalent cation:proton antiporter-2 (CPA2) family protein [Dyadobacter psychrotolerans]TDE11554.1 potassium transporter [Dyadobacter psychrotolerans]
MQQTFFFQAMIYLAAAVIMVPIAKRLGLGSVLGYLVAGIIIGPACLKFIGTEGQDIMHFAEFGVVMMLFVIGLELEPSRLWRMRKNIAGLGGLQVGLTSIVVAGLAILFQVGWKEAIALGMIVAMSSTAIVMQTLDEKGWLKTVAGQSSFAVLLFQDLAIIPMLALFPLLADHLPAGEAHGASHETLVSGLPAWIQAIVVLSSVAVVIVTGKYLLRPVFRLMAKTGMREMFTATALLLVVGIAVLMTSVGLSPALGAFVAGVVLANSEYRHELESSIDPFKGLLLGLFFISVGTSIDFPLIMSKPLTVLGLVTGFMVIKMAVLFGLGKTFEVRNAQNFIFSFGLCQIGEFAFVLLSFSAQQGVLTKETTDTMMAVVAISMALTPLVMMLNEKLILPGLCSMADGTEVQKVSDVEEEDNPVIIAGYGHFGNTIGRFLRANNVTATVLDNDSDNVDFLRRMGLKVYYGDATRYELLEIAGANKAQIIIIAISDEEKRLEMIETIKKHFPNLYILVRSTNRNDAYDLMNAGMMHIYRETFDTSLRVGIDALKLLGHRAHEATRSAKTFFIHDERTLKHLSSIRNEQEYVNAVREHIEELELIMQADRDATDIRSLGGWDRKAEVEEGVEKG